MATYPVINGQSIPQALYYEVYHERSQKWYRALKMNNTISCPQLGEHGYTWGYTYRGRIQGFTRCHKCSSKRWFSLTAAPNIYKK